MYHIPDWTFEFHGHRCPFMPLGYRMGILALEALNIERSKNHELHVFSEMGIGHPQGCLQDGIQASTGATFGKGLMEKLFYGKVAAIFYVPGKPAVRIALNADFVEKLSQQEFFVYRKKGIEPTEIPAEVVEVTIKMVQEASDEELFTVSTLPDFQYHPVKSSFNKAKCEICGEYVFERYLRRKDGITVCIPCAGLAEK